MMKNKIPLLTRLLYAIYTRIILRIIYEFKFSLKRIYRTFYTHQVGL